MPFPSLPDFDSGKTDLKHIEAVATSTAPTATDRFGNIKRTLAGAIAYITGIGEAAIASVSAAAASAIQAIQAVATGYGYQVPVPYAAGIEMTTASQTVTYNDGATTNTYAPLATALPFTTSGTFEAAKFRLVQGVSGADLSATTGSLLVGKAPETGTNANKVSQWLENIGPMVNGLGTIRQTTADTGWSFINDSGHLSRNFNAGSAILANPDGSLTLPHSFTAYKVGTFTVTCDETYSSLGLRIGASVATGTTTLWAYKTLDVAVNLATLSVVPSTYFAGKVTAAVDGSDPGVIVITHPTCGSTSVIPTLERVDSGQGFDNRIVGYAANNQVRVGTFTPFAGYIFYDGSAWQSSTPCKNKPTMSFNTGTGALTVTHETLSGLETVTRVKERDDGAASYLKASASASTATTFVVFFRDPATNAVVTSPSTLMKISYENAATVRRETALGVIALKRENCQLDLAKVASGSGNFWMAYQGWKL